jgi:hypothetical protein
MSFLNSILLNEIGGALQQRIPLHCGICATEIGMGGQLLIRGMPQVEAHLQAASVIVFP